MRRLATYLPLFVLAVGLAIGIAALMTVVLPGQADQVDAATIQQAIDNPQVLLGSAVDPGGGVTSTPATIAVMIPYVQDLGRAPEHPLIKPIASQSGSLNDTDGLYNLSGALLSSPVSHSVIVTIVERITPARINAV